MILWKSTSDPKIFYWLMLIGFVGFDIGGEVGAPHGLGIGRIIGIERITRSGLSQTSVAR